MNLLFKIDSKKTKLKSSLFCLLSCFLSLCPIQGNAQSREIENDISSQIDENEIGDLEARCGRRRRRVGPTGPTGPAGPAGIPGATGLAGSGAIIPYASGLPVALTTVLGGLANTNATMGFGNSTDGILLIGGLIDLSGSAGLNLDHAFSMPVDGTITSISAYFSTAAGVSLIGSTVSITAQLYSSTTPDNLFSPIPGATVTLAPGFTGLVTLGTTSNGITTGLSIPVTAQTRLLMVFSPAVTGGIDIATTILGYGSGGVSIVSP